MNDRRRAVMLAALATESGAEFAPVQVQKLFFLIDENVADGIGGKLFSFEPYDYGPFDSSVYGELEALARDGLVRVVDVGPHNGRRRYTLTPAGQARGEEELRELNDAVRDYIGKVSKWIRGMSFAQLVGAIYKMYPKMREKSVFRD